MIYEWWHFVKCTLVISVIIKFSSVIFLHLLTRVITCQSLTFKSFISNFWIFSVKLFTKNEIDSSERWVCLRLSSLRTGQYLTMFWIDSKLIGAIEPVLSPKSRKYYLIDLCESIQALEYKRCEIRKNLHILTVL